MPEAPEPGLTITAEVVRAARERLRLSVDELAAEVSRRLVDVALSPVPADLVLGWATGERRPSLAEAEALADALLLPFCTLMSDALPRDAVLDFRRIRATANDAEPLSYKTRVKLAQFEAFYRLAKELVHVTGATEDTGVPTAPRGDLRDLEAVEEVGQRIRRAIGLTNERQLEWEDDNSAFADLRASVEGTGAFVFAFALDVDQVRGASKWEGGGPPAVLVNTADAPKARLFTLMHEYAHLVTSPPTRAFVCDPAHPKLGAETVANRIAGAALVPRSILTDVLGVSTPRHLSYGEWPAPLRTELRRALHVSHPVIGIRLAQLGLASAPGSTRSFWRHGGGFGRNKATIAQRYRSYLGKRTVDMAAEAVANERISLGAISRILSIAPKHVEAALIA